MGDARSKTLAREAIERHRASSSWSHPIRSTRGKAITLLGRASELRITGEVWVGCTALAVSTNQAR
ncbi:Hypothetical protein A7982_05268 [Minicystis rosea]|nr:Hypothetical protein A7982_05268 [Minicystis rosea]